MMYDAASNALVYTPKPNELVKFAQIEAARALPNGMVVVPASLDNLQLLAGKGINVPSPLHFYDWPRKAGLEPMQVQTQTVAHMILNKRSFVLSEMRTGKTLSALWAADFLMQQKPGRKAIVLSNLSNLRRTWGKEIFENFLGRRTFAVLHGTAANREKELARDVDFYLLNHDGISVGVARKSRGPLEITGFAAALAARSDIDVVIIDEARAYGDYRATRSLALAQILGHKEYVWPMTGTPTPNGPLDAYGLAKIVNNARGESFRAYRNRTMVQVTQFKWMPKTDSKNAVKDMLSPAIRFTQADCFDAPPEMEEDRDVDLTTQQTSLIRELRREASIKLKDKQIDTANEAALRTKLIQIACGAVYDEKHKSHAVDAKPRIRELLDIIEEAPTKVIVFAPLTNAIDAINVAVGEHHTCAVVDGRTSERERNRILTEFQTRDKPRVLIAHPGPIARGLDLTAAATIVWYAPTDSTEDYLQANQRINGPKQKHTCRSIIKLAATAVEREIFRRLKSNETLQGVVMRLVEEKV